MPAYRIRLTLGGPIATPLHSGTLFGHLCWTYRLTHGEPALTDWLANFAQQPLLLSDACPAGYLPKPLLPAGSRPEMSTSTNRKDFVDRLQTDKTLRKAAWIAVDDFLALRNSLSESRLLARLREQQAGKQSSRNGQIKQVRQAHNTIDRHTGTTPESGGLYFMNETWHDNKAAELDVYAQGAYDREELAALFNRVGELGFGRDATLGRGRFTARVEAADAQLFNTAGNRRISLSHGVLTINMQAPLYKLHTHYGKLGGLYAGGVRSPFKYPLLLTRPGATFMPADDGPFGQLLEGVHPHHPEIRHHALHLCLAYTEADGELQ